MKVRMRREHSARNDDVDTLITYFQGYFKIIIGVTTFGGSVTFSIILADLPSESNIPPTIVRDFVAISWLLFIVGLAEACIFTALLNFYGKHIRTEWGVSENHTKWAWLATVVSTVLSFPLMGAFIFMSLAVMAFTKRVGISGLVITSIVTLFVALSIVIHSPWMSSASGKISETERSVEPQISENDEEIERIVSCARAIQSGKIIGFPNFDNPRVCIGPRLVSEDTSRETRDVVTPDIGIIGD